MDDDDPNGLLHNICMCKTTRVHKKCQIEWIKTSQCLTCPMCKGEYNNVEQRIVYRPTCALQTALLLMPLIILGVGAIIIIVTSPPSSSEPERQRRLFGILVIGVYTLALSQAFYHNVRSCDCVTAHSMLHVTNNATLQSV